MTMLTAAANTSVPGPGWIAASPMKNEGRDPLGLQTTTQDRLMPLLLPDILELSRRARYFTFHAFLLAEYRDRPPGNRRRPARRPGPEHRQPLLRRRGQCSRSPLARTRAPRARNPVRYINDTAR